MKKSPFDVYLTRKVILSIFGEVLPYYESVLADPDLEEHFSDLIRDDYIILCRAKFILENFPFDSLS